MSVFLQTSLVAVETSCGSSAPHCARIINPREGGWLRCKSSSLLVNQWFRRGVAGSQSFGHRRYMHWKYGRSMWGTRRVLAQDVWWCGLVGWEPISLTQVDSALPSFLSKDVCSLDRWRAFHISPLKLLLHQGQRREWHSLTQSICPRRFRVPSLHILHVRCKFCVIRAVERNPQFLHVWARLREKSIVHRDGQAQERAQEKLERNRRWFERKKIYLSRSGGERTRSGGERTLWRAPYFD